MEALTTTVIHFSVIHFKMVMDVLIFLTLLTILLTAFCDRHLHYIFITHYFIVSQEF